MSITRNITFVRFIYLHIVVGWFRYRMKTFQNEVNIVAVFEERIRAVAAAAGTKTTFTMVFFLFAARERTVFFVQTSSGTLGKICKQLFAQRSKYKSRNIILDK